MKRVQDVYYAEMMARVLKNDTLPFSIRVGTLKLETSARIIANVASVQVGNIGENSMFITPLWIRPNPEVMRVYRTDRRRNSRSRFYMLFKNSTTKWAVTGENNRDAMAPREMARSPKYMSLKQIFKKYGFSSLYWWTFGTNRKTAEDCISLVKQLCNDKILIDVRDDTLSKIRAWANVIQACHL